MEHYEQPFDSRKPELKMICSSLMQRIVSLFNILCNYFQFRNLIEKHPEAATWARD